MSRLKKLALPVLALLGVAVVMPVDAEARRYRRAFVRRPAVVYRAPVVRRAPVVVRAPFVGVGVGRFGGVSVAAPGVRIGVGW